MNWKKELEALSESVQNDLLSLQTEGGQSKLSLSQCDLLSEAIMTTFKGWLLSNLPEKAPSVEQHFKDHAYFNKWLKELDEGKRETILYMLEEYGKYFSAKPASNLPDVFYVPCEKNEATNYLDDEGDLIPVKKVSLLDIKQIEK